MGKLTSSVDIVPVDDAPPENIFSRPPRDVFFGYRPNMNKMPYISDPTLVPRVQKYLESNVEKTYVDINEMADYLQRVYREYGKRKRSAFRSSVKKAYSVVLHSYGLQEPGSSADDVSEESDDNEDHSFGGSNTLSAQLLEMYKRQQPVVEDDELIDISSDDSNDATAPCSTSSDKPTNGASTSQKNKSVLLAIPAFANSINKGVARALREIPTPLVTLEKAKKRKSDGMVVGSPKVGHKRAKILQTIQEPSVCFKDIGGMDKVLEHLCTLLVHIKHPEIYRQIGISPPRGFLLHGPPGCGKTLLANAIAGELGVSFLKVAAPELVAGVSGQSEERIRELFERAVALAPCILFIDEVDAITQNRQNAQKDMEKRIVAQLLTCLDYLNENSGGDQVLVIGATNSPDTIDPALRRAGRFDREISIGIPNQQARMSILKVVTAKLKLADGFEFETIAKYTPGFVGADLMSLTRGASITAVNRVFSELKEKRNLEKALALQKASQNLLAKQKSAEEEVTKSSESIDVESSRDSISSENKLPESTEKEPSETNDPIVVIDEDEKLEKSSEKETPTAAEKLNEEETAKLQAALDLLQPPKTNLEELLGWLHDKSPLPLDQLSSLYVTMEDFAEALKTVQPSAKREGFATVPDVTWDDVGSLKSIREELQLAILGPVRHEEYFKQLGLNKPTGVLLCGPPGCGKTLLAKAIANEAGINFISVKGPELLNMYVGESERAVRVCFQRARNSAPCVIFFDELDSLCPRRSDSGDGGGATRVVNQMLTEMDGIEGRQGVYILAATNRPDIIDPAVMRPGRLDKILYVGLPSSDDRVDILRAITKNGTQPTLAPDVDLEAIGKSSQCDGYTGADLAALVHEAGLQALREVVSEPSTKPAAMVTTEHFNRAVLKIRRSTSDKDQKYYENLKKKYLPSSQISDVEEMEYS